MFFVQALSSPIKRACHFIYSTIAGSVYPWKVLGIYTRISRQTSIAFFIFREWGLLKYIFFYAVRGAVCEKHFLTKCEAVVLLLDLLFFYNKRTHAFCFCCEISQAVRE